MLGRRVAVTGLGVVAPCGVGRDAFWSGLLGPGLSGGRTTAIADWDPTPYFANPKEARRERFVGQGARGAGLFSRRRPGSKAGY